MRVLLSMLIMLSTSAAAEEPRVSSAEANAVAKDAALAGNDVLGPLGLLPFASLVSPLAAGFIAGEAAEEAIAPVSTTAGLVGAAYAGAIAFEAAGLASAVIVTGLFASVQVPLYAAQVALLYNWITLARRPGGVTIGVHELTFYLALAALYGGLNAILVVALLSVPRLAGTLARLQAADALDGRLPRGAVSVEKTRSRPWSVPRTWGLLAAAMSGAWMRSAAWAYVPVVGPFIAWRLARNDVQERVGQAHRVAGRTARAPSRISVDVLLGSRALVMAAVQVGFLAYGALVVVAGGLALATALALALDAPRELPLAMLVAMEGLLIPATIIQPLAAIALVGLVLHEGFATPLTAIIGAVSSGTEVE